MSRPGTLLAALVVAAVPGLSQSPEEAAVQVAGNPGCGSLSQGSGVVIAPGVVATNAHVVQGSARVQVTWRGRAFQASAHILAPDLDLCLLKVPALAAQAPRFAAPSPLESGMFLRSVGFPGGAGPVSHPGKLTATWRFRTSVILQTSTPVQHGSSGGGLYDAEDRLVGLTTFGFLSHEGAWFAVPVSWALELLGQPWQEGALIPVCRPNETLLFEFLEHMTEDPSNRGPWEAFVRAWIDHRPKDPDAWYGLGHVLWTRVQATAERSGGAPDPDLLEAALQAYRKATELGPGRARAWNNLGASYDAVGAYPDALAAYRMALALKPDYGLAWINLAGTHVNLGQFAEARNALSKGLGLAPDEAQAWARLGFCEGALGCWTESAEAFAKALRFHPLRFDWWTDRARALVRAQDAAGLDRLLEDLDQRFPGRSDAVRRALPPRPPERKDVRAPEPTIPTPGPLR